SSSSGGGSSPARTSTPATHVPQSPVRQPKRIGELCTVRCRESSAPSGKEISGCPEAKVTRKVRASTSRAALIASSRGESARDRDGRLVALVLREPAEGPPGLGEVRGDG